MPRDEVPDTESVVMSTPESQIAPPRRWRPGPIELVAIAVSALVLLLAVGGYLAGYFLAGDKLPKNAVVAGIAVGGLSPSEAEQKLTTNWVSEPASRSPSGVNETETTIDPVQAGLGLDVPASVAQAGGGRSFDPRHIWRVLTGGSATDPVTTVDQAKLDAAVAALAEKTDRAAENASLAYRGMGSGKVEVRQRKGSDGVRLDRAETADRVRAGYLNEPDPVEAVAAVTEPEISTAEVEQLAQSFARPAVSGPVTLKAEGSKEFEVTPRMIAASVTFPAQDGKLAPKLDAEKLHEAAEPAFTDVDLATPKDAKVVIRDGKPTIVGGTNGASIKTADLASAVEPVLVRRGAERTATVAATTTEPDFTRADAQKLGIKEVTGKFTTRFPYAEYRNHNIGRAGELINNTLLQPGKTFSLNKTLGERTRKNGYVKGYIIRDGRFRMELGGGVSQSATTTFNAAFFAGLKDVEHRPHGLYINRYPAGREATVFWPDLDLRVQERHRLRRPGPGHGGEGDAEQAGPDHRQDVVDQDLRQGRVLRPTPLELHLRAGDPRRQVRLRGPGPRAGIRRELRAAVLHRRQGRQDREVLLALQTDQPRDLYLTALTSSSRPRPRRRGCFPHRRRPEPSGNRPRRPPRHWPASCRRRTN